MGSQRPVSENDVSKRLKGRESMRGSFHRCFSMSASVLFIRKQFFSILNQLYQYISYEDKNLSKTMRKTLSSNVRRQELPENANP